MKCLLIGRRKQWHVILPIVLVLFGVRETHHWLLLFRSCYMPNIASTATIMLGTVYIRVMGSVYVRWFKIITNSVIKFQKKKKPNKTRAKAHDSSLSSFNMSPSWASILICRVLVFVCSLINRPFPSSTWPLYQNEVKNSAFDIEMIIYFNAKKTDFHKKGCALGLIFSCSVFILLGFFGTRNGSGLFRYNWFLAGCLRHSTVIKRAPWDP